MRIQKSKPIKVKSFVEEDDEPRVIKIKKSSAKNLPVKIGQSFLSRPIPKSAPTQSFFKKPVKVEQDFFLFRRKHDKLCELEDLHDDEDYSFMEYMPGGYVTRTVGGYNLKHCWDMYERAFSEPTSPRMRRRIPSDTNWVEVELPNGKVINVQPRSLTPSYFRRRG